MFWEEHPVVLRRKGKALVVGFIVSVFVAIACVILSVLGSSEAAVVAMVAAAAAVAAGNWAHWAFRDASKLGRSSPSVRKPAEVWPS